MIEKIQHATASSPEGARGLVKGVLACAFQNMAFMLPTGLLYLLVKDLLAGSTSGRTSFYLLGCAVCFALILLTTWFQYNGTYFTTYKESGTRRLTLAERLRKLPLSFFGKRDLADLTSTIMADCEVLEKDCSHFIPGLFGSLISTVLIALSLFTFDGRMALAALWVIPVSVAIVVGSYRVQDKVQAKTMAAKMACADGIQEYIETLRDLKASNAEQRYLSGLSGKIRAVEKQSIAAELETALFVSSASMVLKLGIASVALTGSVLLVQGSIDVLTLFLFLMAASRMYDPMQGALQNLAAVIAMRTNVGRMNEILDAPLQTGSEQLTNQGCDIVFDHVGFAYNSGETVRDIASFYKIPPEKIIVIFDDISLPCGRLRIRRKGTDGGHNGIKSIIYQLQSDQFPRIKLGIGAKLHPEQPLADWVLSVMKGDDLENLRSACLKACDAIPLLVNGETEKAMGLYNAAK